jgi:succinoglycan biosynthesis transport protein ExoP
MESLKENFRILRIRVESQTALPAIVVVSAAMSGDGTTYVASGLARAFAEAGHRTLLLEANTARPGVAECLEIRPIPPTCTAAALHPRQADIPDLWVSALRGGPADGTMRDLTARMRNEFAVTVIDAAAIPASSTALQFSHAADALLVAVRSGRRACAADQELLRLIGDGDVRLLGIVPTKARGRRVTPPLTTPQLVPEVEAPAQFVPRAGVRW